MWEGTHTCCGQKIKLGPLYIIRCFNGRLKWEICSICLVSLKDQEETTMSALHAVWIKKKKKKRKVRPETVERGHMETWWRSRGGVWAVSSPACTRIIKIPGTSHNLLRNITITWTLKWIVAGGFCSRNRRLWLAACCRSRALTLMYLPLGSSPLLPSGGLVQHRERRRPRPRRVWQHVRPQQLETRAESSQAGAGGVCGE